MKRWIALLLAVVLMLCGCQHVTDAFSEEEEQAMKDAARALAAAWLAENEPAAVLGNEEGTFCDTVTDWHKYYLSGYVMVRYKLGEEQHVLMVNPENGGVFSDENTDVLQKAAEKWIPALFGIPTASIAASEIDVDYNLPVTYQKTAELGRFPYSRYTGFLPACSADDLEEWLKSPQKRGVLELSCELEVSDPAALDGFHAETIRRIEEENGLSFSWLRVSDTAMRVVSTLQENGGVCEAHYETGSLGPYTAEYLSSVIREEPQEDGTFSETRAEFDLAQCVRSERDGDGQAYVIDAPDDMFYCMLSSDRRLPEMDKTWTWYYGDETPLHWLKKDGSYRLVDEQDVEVPLWTGGKLTVS